MKPKYQRLATVRKMIKVLKSRQQDAKDELRVLESAITFYEEMSKSIVKEGAAL